MEVPPTHDGMSAGMAPLSKFWIEHRSLLLSFLSFMARTYCMEMVSLPSSFRHNYRWSRPRDSLSSTDRTQRIPLIILTPY